MLVPPARPLVAAAAAAAFAALALAGCSSSGSTTSGTAAGSSPVTAPSTSAGGSRAASGGAPGGSSAAGGSSYQGLLIKPSDIPIAGFKLTTTQEPPGGKGAVGLYTSADGSRTISDILTVLPSADAADISIKAAAAAAGSAIAGAKATDFPVGRGGKLFAGTTGGGTRQETVVIFDEGKAFVTMSFDSAKGDVVPTEVVTQVATAQDAALKANPPS